jgi:hypothetical protein
MIWNIKLNQGRMFGTQWYSNRRFVDLPRQWSYAPGQIAILAYITEPESELLKSKTPDETAGPQGITFYGVASEPNVNVGELVNYAPLYWLSELDHPMTRLTYLTDEQIQIIEAADLHNSNIGSEHHYGPQNIPSYNGSGGGDGNTPGETSSQSGIGNPGESDPFSSSGGIPGNLGGYSTIGGFEPGSTPEEQAARMCLAAQYASPPLAAFGGGDSGGYDGGPGTGVPFFPTIGPNSGVYSGSLSSLGNMVAMALGTGEYQVKILTAGVTAQGSFDVDQTVPITTWANLTPAGSAPFPTAQISPYSVGYIREYWQDPAGTTFGANSAIPALTGVFPDPFTNFGGAPITDRPGNFVAYADLQMQRLSGSNTWDNAHFMNVFNQALGWVLTSNDYLAALQNAQSNTLSNFGSANYRDFVSQGFDKYQQGLALRKALVNVGTMVQVIPEGFFGTPNAVAKFLVDIGLGSVGGLSEKLYTAGVNFDDIYNPGYVNPITNILNTITNQADLVVIQDVVESTIPKIFSPMAYTSIEIASGLTNDSAFPNFAAFGRDIFQRAPGLSSLTGVSLVALIDSVQTDITANVEAITGNVTVGNSVPLLSQSIIDSLRTYLPLGAGNGPVSILNVIGTGSGYLLDGIRAVNLAISQLYATDYGPQIRDILTEISRFQSAYALTEEEVKAAASFTPVPAPGVAADGSFIPGGPNYWQTKVEAKKTEYLNLLSAIAADPTGEIPTIVAQINENWLWCCRTLYYEMLNYNRANFTVTAFNDNSQYLSFVSSLPSYGADPQNIGTDYLLYGICLPNEAGDTVKAVLGQGKTNQILGENGVLVKNII